MVLSPNPSGRSKSQAVFESALKLHRAGDRSGARRLYRKILKSQPNNAQVLNLLGLAANQEKRREEAVEWLRKALDAEPDFAPALRNLGNVLVDLGDYSEACQLYQRALVLEPADGSLHANLSVARRNLGELEQAIASGRRATQLSPQESVAWYTLGNAYRASHQYPQAAASYRRALELNADFSPARDALCRSLMTLESRSFLGRRRLRKTREAYQDWLNHEPNNPLARFMLLALDGERPERAPDEVIAELFDRSADTFEEHLGRLEYQGPELTRQLLKTHLGKPAGDLSVLDAGCGTGLCGSFLRAYAGHLVGVDLSPGMLARARAKNLYDELVEAELGAFLAGHPDHYDLVLMIDTLCYFGKLETIFKAAAAVLKPGAGFVFTVELAAEGAAGAGYRLHTHGRYSHKRSYLESALATAGFDLVEVQTIRLRMESRMPVTGLLVLARPTH